MWGWGEGGGYGCGGLGEGGRGERGHVIVSYRVDYIILLSLYEVFYREVLFRYMSQPNHEYNPSRCLLLYGAPNSNISSRAYS